MPSLLKILSGLLLVFISFKTSSTGNVGFLDLSQDAWIWPGKVRKGYHLTYSKSANWADLWTLLTQEGFYTVGKLCVKGVFIIYQEPNYAVTSEDALDILSGNIRCKMLPQITKSIQLVGSMGYMRRASITFFEELNFGSIAHPTVNNQGSSFFDGMTLTQSAIIIGRDPWAIEMKDGFRFCVQPEFDIRARFPICLIRSFPALLMISDDRISPEFVRVTRGCEQVTEEMIYKVQDCTYWGKTPKSNSAAVKLITPDSKAKGRSLGGNNLCSDEEKKNLVFALYRAAITGSMEAEIGIDWPKIGKNVWKLDIIDWIFTIVIDLVDPAIIPPNFLSRTRELFIRKLATVWGNKTTKEVDLPRGEQDYDTLLQQLETCSTTLGSRSGTDSSFFEVFRKVWSEMQTAEDFEGKIDPNFERKPSLDIITEMVWISGHIVGHLCHELFIRAPFWAFYYNLFLNWYMLPVVPEWKKPTEGLNLIFGGLNYTVEYNKLALFATLLRKESVHLELLNRPAEVVEETGQDTKKGS